MQLIYGVKVHAIFNLNVCKTYATFDGITYSSPLKGGEFNEKLIF